MTAHLVIGFDVEGRTHALGYPVGESANCSGGVGAHRAAQPRRARHPDRLL